MGAPADRCVRCVPTWGGHESPPTSETVMHRYLALYGRPTSFAFVVQDHAFACDAVGNPTCCDPPEAS